MNSNPSSVEHSGSGGKQDTDSVQSFGKSSDMMTDMSMAYLRNFPQNFTNLKVEGQSYSDPASVPDRNSSPFVANAANQFQQQQQQQQQYGTGTVRQLLQQAESGNINPQGTTALAVQGNKAVNSTSVATSSHHTILSTPQVQFSTIHVENSNPADVVVKQEQPKPPKKPLTPYMTFSKTIWQQVKAGHQNSTVCQVGAIIGGLWRELTDTDKQPYNEAFAKDKMRYETEMQEFTKATGLKASDLIKPKEKRATPMKAVSRQTKATNSSSTMMPPSGQANQAQTTNVDLNNGQFGIMSNFANVWPGQAGGQYLVNEQGNLVGITASQQQGANGMGQVLPFYSSIQSAFDQSGMGAGATAGQGFQASASNQVQNNQAGNQYFIHLKPDGTPELVLQNVNQAAQANGAKTDTKMEAQEAIQQQLRSALNEKQKEVEVLSIQLAQAYEIIHQYKQQLDLVQAHFTSIQQMQANGDDAATANMPNN